MIPDMGWHFLNPAIQGRSWQLGAFEPAPPSTSGTRTW
jgi:hypothetical protein